jgi:hypothetical protein
MYIIKTATVQGLWPDYPKMKKIKKNATSGLIFIVWYKITTVAGIA